MSFAEHPGLIYVVITLLPLASFLVLFLAGGIRQYLRTYRQSSFGESLYLALGGDKPPRWPAYIATAAIGLSCLLSLWGFIQFSREAQGLEHEKKGLEHKITEREAELHGKFHGLPEEERIAAEEADTELQDLEAKLREKEGRWSEKLSWLRVRVPSLHDPERGTALQLGFYIDSLSATMFLMVTFVATLIHIFSIGYMSDETDEFVEDHHVHGEDGHYRRRGRFGRFFMYLSLFCFSMLNLILADNLFQVFISWELVGICSFLLIGFYYERRSASNAANKAFITNRVGDAGFIIGLLIVWTYLGTFDFQDAFKRVRAPITDAHSHPVPLAGQIVRASEADQPLEGGKFLTLPSDGQGDQVLLFPLKQVHSDYAADTKKGTPADPIKAFYNPKEEQHGFMPYWLLVAGGLGIFLGCVGKSAQFPLQVWLPDAMEGPTPVSALIHAATMVAAGVYLVGRCYPLFPKETLLVIAYVGAITLFVAATIAVVMTDIKKVLAYSTVSQLGYMMLALGVGGWVAGLFHLLTHAFFKALLFLGSGSVIYGCHHEQEMTKMGGLYPRMKITALTMLAGVLAIAGMPLLSGWYSKDAILAQAIGFASVHRPHLLLFALPLLTAGLTTFYMFRMWFMTFTGKPRDHHVHEHAHESPWLMTVPLMALAACSIGVAWGWPPWDAKQSALEHFLHHSQPDAVQADFGTVVEAGEVWEGGRVIASEQTLKSERVAADELHDLAGYLALVSVVLGVVFAAAIYYYRVLDPADAREQFPAVHSFLTHKWYFDELYSAVLVRPALVVSSWCKAFDLKVIDGFLDGTARLTILVSRWDGLFDKYVVDGMVNVVGDTFWSVGARLREVQTGYLRSYILFLGLAAIAVFVILLYFVAMAAAR
jgi:NADH-quinone oxidoreductase subunit L